MAKKKIVIPSNAEAIREAIADLAQRVKQLEAENQKLKKQLEKTRVQNKQARQRMRSQAGQLKAAKAKIQTLRVALRKSKAAIRKTRSIKIQSVTKRTRAQYLSEKKPEFIKRFIQRLHETYADFKPEWDETVRVALMSIDYDEIDSIMKMLNLDSMYYESNGYRPNTGATGKMIYDYFVQFIPQPLA